MDILACLGLVCGKVPVFAAVIPDWLSTLLSIKLILDTYNISKI